MPRVVCEVNAATNIVEKIYPYVNLMTIDPEPGRYAVPNVPDNIVELGWVCDRSTNPATFFPNPNPPQPDSELSQRQLAQSMLEKATEMTQKATALLNNIG